MSAAADESSLLSLRPPCTELLKCALTILLSESPFMSAGWMGYTCKALLSPLSRMSLSSMDGQGRGREGGLKGASSSPPPPLLLCLDNIMLCVHVHNSYWDRVFLGRGILQNNAFSSDLFDISFFAFEGPLRLRRYEYEFVAECVPCGLF